MGSIGSRDVRVACIALACVVVPASAASAAADYFLKLEGVKGESKADKHKGEIEIQSFSWGASRASDGSYDALTDGLIIMRNTDPPAPAAAAKAGGTGLGKGKASMSDLSVMRGPRQTTSMDGTHVVAGDVDGDGRADAAAAGRHGVGMPSVKRTHSPIKIIRPLETGSMTMNMKLAGCAVGTRYPSAELTTPGGRYALQDLVVASCGGGSGGSLPTEQVTLNYTKVKVRAWNPEKKEE